MASQKMQEVERQLQESEAGLVKLCQDLDDIWVSLRLQTDMASDIFKNGVVMNLKLGRLELPLGQGGSSAHFLHAMAPLEGMLSRLPEKIESERH